MSLATTILWLALTLSFAQLLVLWGILYYLEQAYKKLTEFDEEE